MFNKVTLLFITICSTLFSQEIDLNKYEASIYSQNGEDGVLAGIFTMIGVSSKFCVELGAGDGMRDSNTCLLRKQGWNCLLLDRAFENPPLHLHKAFITAENVGDLFNLYKIPLNLDLLSIDLRYNDYYVWQALDLKYQPRVVVIHYNSSHLPDQDKVVKYRPYFAGDDTVYFGASILALYKLGRAKGYSLIYAEQTGRALFFIRDDILEDKNLLFKNVNDVQALYRNSLTSWNEDLKNREWVSSEN